MRRVALGIVCFGLLAGAGCSKLGPPAVEPAKPAPALNLSNERDIAYEIERQDHDATVVASEDFRFQSGDKFRLRVRPGFAAYLYVVNRGAHENSYHVLFPVRKEKRQNPLAKGTAVTVPMDDWMRFDKTPGNEYMLLIASTVALPALEQSPEIPRDTFEADLAEIERQYQPNSSRRFRDGDWMKFFAGKDGDLALVSRLALRHE